MLHPPLTFHTLLQHAHAHAPNLFPAPPYPSANPVITAVAQDHRRVTTGALYVARAGANFDGHELLEAAEASGAAALLGERDLARLPYHPGIPYLQLADTRAALPFLAAAVNLNPSEALRVIGVTGTDGKTTTSYLLQWLLSERHVSGLLSTAGIWVGELQLDPEGHFTTPEATEVQATLARFVTEGASHAVLESSSHAFAMHRLDAVRYRLGLMTNLSPEHLDYHGTIDAYREAKATLFRRAERAVLNRDDDSYEFFRLAARNGPRPLVGAPTNEGALAGDGPPREVMTYGEHVDADLRLLQIESVGAGLELEFSLRGRTFAARLPMLGRYNAWNAAAALAAAVLEGVAVEAAAARLASFPGVPGRMQLVATHPVTVIVDFAHTAPALAGALSAVAGAGARIVVVVGAAGERDANKRGRLGATAVSGADLAVFTEEDSRREDVHDILAAMAEGAAATGAGEGDRYLVEPDRSRAIRLALSHARPGDVVLLAGKGHERTLERGNETLPWDEVAEARRALAELGRH